MTSTPTPGSALVALILGLATLPVAAQNDAITTVRVQFEPGAESAVVEDSITGYESVDYLLGAQAGQYANISMASDNGSNYFNIIPPGEENVALFIGSTSGNQYEGTLPATGDYRVRVYLMRNAARREETANYRLEMIIAAGNGPGSDPASGPAGTGDTTAQTIPTAPEDGGPRQWEVTAEGGLNMRESPSTTAPVVATLEPGAILSNLGCEGAAGRVWCDVQPVQGGARGYVVAEFLAPAVGPQGGVATGADDSALRAGRGEFDATGPLPCAQRRGQPLGECQFGVARAGGGDATVVVTHPDGFQRVLFFTRGEFTGADASEAGGGFDTEVTKEADLFRIRVDDERYEMSEAVILGG
ncbi:MAG: SH3 domain-containing protein [Candidatus Competibacterales bacterium]